MKTNVNYLSYITLLIQQIQFKCKFGVSWQNSSLAFILGLRILPGNNWTLPRNQKKSFILFFFFHQIHDSRSQNKKISKRRPVCIIILHVVDAPAVDPNFLQLKVTMYAYQPTFFHKNQGKNAVYIGRRSTQRGRTSGDLWTIDASLTEESTAKSDRSSVRLQGHARSSVFAVDMLIYFLNVLLVYAFSKDKLYIIFAYTVYNKTCFIAGMQSISVVFG